MMSAEMIFFRKLAGGAGDSGRKNYNDQIPRAIIIPKIRLILETIISMEEKNNQTIPAIVLRCIAGGILLMSIFTYGWVKVICRLQHIKVP
jgi:hypothetical protein